jgi:large subunit ribosomal protein L10
MAVSKQAKVEALSVMEKGLAEAQATVFVSFDKMTVAQINEMRRKLEVEGVHYKVVKKTLLARALGNTKTDGSVPTLDGNIAMAWSSTDASAPAREIFNFAKDNKIEGLKLVGGIFENKYQDAKGINEIATIPDMLTLRGMFLNVINSSRQGFAVVLSEYAKAQ